MPKQIKTYCFLPLLALCLLFSQCTKNRKARYLPIVGISTVDSVSKDTVYHTVKNFTMVDQMGQTVTQDTFRHRVYVANFFFVSCMGICRQMNSEMERVQKAYKGNNLVKFVSFSVDPEDDSIPRLAEYATEHDAVPYQWYFLRGKRDEVLELARHSYLAESDGYLVHSQNLTLIDMEGRIRGVYSGTVPADVDRLIRDINLLLKEEQLNSRS